MKEIIQMKRLAREPYTKPYFKKAWYKFQTSMKEWYFYLVTEDAMLADMRTWSKFDSPEEEDNQKETQENVARFIFKAFNRTLLDYFFKGRIPRRKATKRHLCAFTGPKGWHIEILENYRYDKKKRGWV